MTATAWHTLCKLREDVQTGSLDESEFAAKLNGVRMDANAPEIYRDAEKFFSRTFPTLRMKEIARDVLLRLAAQGGKPVVQLQVAYGGGKTHTLITLLHLAERAAEVADNPTVKEFIAAAGLKGEIPVARVALLPMDDMGYIEGIEVKGPDGATRWVKTPWGALAYQLAGDAGFARVQQHEANFEPPGEPLLKELLAAPQSEGKSALILLDEAVMYCRKAVNAADRNLGILKDFFQLLTQAVSATPRACLVATLLASENEADDVTGARVLRVLEDVFGRVATPNDPVGRDDLAEVLRRRLFESCPVEAERRPIIDAIFAAYAKCKPMRDAQKDNAAYQRHLKSYPFHPDVQEVLYVKWTELPKFQRTRGALRLLALALKESYGSDPSLLVGIHAFLGSQNTLPQVVTEMARICSDGQDMWTAKLNEELDRAREAQDKAKALKQREIEQAVLATFLHCQPSGQKADTADLYALLTHPGVDMAALETGLDSWRDLSWFLTEETNVWRITTQPNLTHIHVNAMDAVHQKPGAIADALREQIGKVKELAETNNKIGGADSGVIVHNLPVGPKDVDGDTPDLRYLVLNTDCAVRIDAAPPAIPDAARVLFDKRGAAQTNREFRNALVALAPDAMLLNQLRLSLVEYLAWKQVEISEQGRQLGPEQKKTLAARMKIVEDRLPAFVRAMYNILLDLDEEGNLRAQSLKSPDALGLSADARPFMRIKATLKAEDRLIIDELAPELLLPGSYYELWNPGETAKKAQEIFAAFAKFPRLPRFLSAQIFRNTLARGCEEGVMALRLLRPDKTFRTLWRVRPASDDLTRPELEILPAERAELTELDPALLAPGALPNLWKSATEPILLRDAAAYFNGKSAPALKENALVHAVSHAVQLGILWARAPSRSFFKELLTPEALTDTLELMAPPSALKPEELSPDALPDIWRDKEAHLDAIGAAVSKTRGYAIPWTLLTGAVTMGLHQRLWEISSGSVWPCGPEKAGQVVLTLGVKSKVKEPAPQSQPTLPTDVIAAGGAVTAIEISKIAEILSDLTDEAPSLAFSYEFFITAKGDDANTAVEKLNAALTKANIKIKFNG